MTITNAQRYARLRDEQFSLFENYARKHGMNSKSLLVFMWIYHNQDGLTQETIAKKTFSTKQVIQAIVKTYMSKGWLYLEPSQTDRRKKLVKLTELGFVRVKSLLTPLCCYEEEAMQALTPTQQEVLLEATQLFSQKLMELLESHEVGTDA